MAVSRGSALHSVFFPFLLWLLLLAVLSPPPALAASLSSQVAGEIRSALEQEPIPRFNLGRDIVLNADILPAFYRNRSYLPAWIDDLGLTSAARHLISMLRDAGTEGLCPEDYHLTLIEPLLGLEADYLRHGVLFDPVYIARLDLLLTDAFLLYASHLNAGRVDASQVQEGWWIRPRKADLLRLLDRARRNDSLAWVVADLIPPHDGYLLLRIELERYRNISALGGWPSIPSGPVLRPGDSDFRLPLLRKRLLLTGDLPEPDDLSGNFFDAATAEALARFQRRHGLDDKGVLGQRTLNALNIPAETRVRQIELNLERWRWLPQDLGDRYIQINIADFKLSLLENGREIMSMPVVVGKGYRKTPVFSARLSYLIFAPYWNVPPTILREDKLPLIKADPGFLKRHHYEIVTGSGENPVRLDPRQIRWKNVTAETFPGILRQRPGAWNPLGSIKFMLPNPYDVYLHDTPDKHLFERDHRTFSSGCIRIERPIDLAQYLLESQGWDCDHILEAMEIKSPLRIDLRSPLPVHVLYWTAWVDGEGVLQFRNDVYLRDLDLELALGKSKDED